MREPSKRSTKFGFGVIIFFLALVALVAEIILYFIFGIGASLSGGASSIGGIAAFFVWLIILTIVAGISAPICGFFENVSKKPHLGMYIFLPILGLTAIGAGGLLLLGHALSSKSGTQATSSPGYDTRTPASNIIQGAYKLRLM